MDDLSVDALTAALDASGCSWGQPITVSDTSQSTNDDAKAAASRGAPSGAVFTTRQQLDGRGRGGKSWFSDPIAGLAFSVVVRPRLKTEHIPELSLVAGLSVVEAIGQLGCANAQLKWPNDVLINDRKVAGILCEASGSVVSVVIGIGINVGQHAFPPSVANIATSLDDNRSHGAAPSNRSRVLAQIVAALERNVAVHERHGLAALLPKLRQRDALLSRRVSVDGRPGIARGIDASGMLLVEDSTGALRALHAGTVQRLDT